MNLFKQMESDRKYPPRRILLYGIHGIGLSSFAAGLPAPVFVPADDSTVHLHCQRFPVARRFSDLMQALQDLYIEPHDYRTVILDPLGALEWMIRDEVCAQRQVKHLAELPNAAGHVLHCWRRLLRRLELLRNDIYLHVILVGHAREPSMRIARHGILQRQQPALSCRPSALLQRWCDEVLFATHSDASSTVAGQPATDDASSVAAESASDPRILYTTPSPRHAAKNHLDLPPQLPLRAEALAPYLRKAPASPHVPPGSLN